MNKKVRVLEKDTQRTLEEVLLKILNIYDNKDILKIKSELISELSKL